MLHLPCAAGKSMKIAQLESGELLSPLQTPVFVAQW